MRRKFASFLVLLSTVFIFIFPVNGAKAADCSQYEGVNKIFWNGVELKSGQIGRLTILKDTPLYKLDGEKQTFSRTLKKGEFYRIYAFKPGKLSVGGGYYIDRDERIQYETPSKAKLEAVKCINQPLTNVIDITKNNVLPVDASKSIISLKRLNNVTGLLVFDSTTENYRFVPLSVKGMIQEIFASKDAVYVNYFNIDVKGLNAYTVYKYDINSPFKATKVLDNIRNATTDGKNLYSIEFNNFVLNGQEVKGTQIFKTDLFGKGKKLIEQFPDFPLLYERALIVKNDFVYFKALNTTTKLTEVHKIPAQGGDSEMLFDYNATNLYFNHGPEFFLSYASGLGKKDFFYPNTDTLFSFKGPEPHYDQMIEVYNDKLYYVDENFKLNQVDEKGVFKNIPVTVQGEIIGLADNYLYYLDKNIIKKIKFID